VRVTVIKIISFYDITFNLSLLKESKMTVKGKPVEIQGRKAMGPPS
jgi:hypothetical protein